MIKTVRLLLFLLLGMALGPATSFSLHVTAGQAEVVAIQGTLDAYFQGRYRAHQTFQLKEIEAVIGHSPAAQVFLDAEAGKLAVELHHLERNQLRYVSYQYYLDYQDITVDEAAGTAVISLFEGHDVVFEHSEKTSLFEPMPSRMRNLHHRITMQKEGNAWKITGDLYQDYLWRVIRSGGIQMEELIVEDSPPAAHGGIPGENQRENTTSCSLPDDPSSEAYDRGGAAAYAHRWATALRPYNPDYFDFTDYGGDCTNFVSQAIHEGGGAQMVGENTYGWYYNSVTDRSAAWTGVYYLHKFITQYADFPAGPEGCAVSVDLAEIGDVIQFSWKGDIYWNHSVIIVQTEEDLQGNLHLKVAGHTPDVDFYPYEYFLVGYPDAAYRFLHIERVDGLRLHLPLFVHWGYP